jgi:signal transduction histidine kinase
MVECRPDQKQALGRIRAGGKQLLATIDNLVDLTQIDERPLLSQPIAITTIMRDAADSARCIADEAGVTITVVDDGTEITAIGDAWATRRILDNLIANAIRFTPPGGTVSLAIDQASDQVTASVSDTGRGLPPGLAGSLGPDATTPPETLGQTPNGAGLTLSNRLAQGMNGRLLLESPPGLGARVSLRLPATTNSKA